MRSRYSLLLLLLIAGCAPLREEVPQWTTYEITLNAGAIYENPYTEVNLTAVFTHESGLVYRRPGFWDGGNVWKVRFAPPNDAGLWKWRTMSEEPGLVTRGSFIAAPYEGDNELYGNGLLTMSPGRRNVVHRSGKPFLVVGDTPWAIPFRATPDQVSTYAQDRQTKGFNVALLMSLQPDMHATGPDARNTDQGFARAFYDLGAGHIQQLNPDYFKTLDSLVTILVDHEIVPVYQPVFHGFGWKGLDVLGNHIDPDEYVHYTHYLLARYGSMPAMWLIAGDNGGDDPGVREAGEMLQTHDDYGQPTGLHYNPCDDYVANWAIDNPVKHCMHYNKSHQEASWLDFQWAQTGHDGAHLYHKVSRLYDTEPTKAVANGEPTYEGMNAGQNGLGWWQGEEAWMQLMHGGTMGVVYGAASLWQWKISADEAGWTDWATQDKSWREALEMEGSTYVGLVGQILEGLDLTDIEKRWDLAGGKPLLARPGAVYLAFVQDGEPLRISSVPTNFTFRWVNPKNGAIHSDGRTTNNTFTPPDGDPWVLIIAENLAADGRLRTP